MHSKHFGGGPAALAARAQSAANRISLDDLPAPNTTRWVIRRKAIVVAAVRAGLISLEEACERYTLSVEEFESWQRLIDSHGPAGLRVTRLQHYRDTNRDAR